MLNFSNSPFLTLKDYTINLTPKKDYLNLYSKFQLESNFHLPNEILEISYTFPNQNVDKLFLRRNDKEICYPSLPHLECSIFENWAFADSKHDNLFSNKRKDFSSIDFQVNFNLNSYFSPRKYDLKNIFKWNSLNQALNNIKLKNSFDWKNIFYINKKNSFKGYKDLKILDEIIFQKNKENSYSYYLIRLYLENDENKKFNLPTFYLQDISKKGDTKSINKDSFSGKLFLFQDSGQNPLIINLEENDFQLEEFLNSYWKFSFTTKLFKKITEKIEEFYKGKLELQLEINRLDKKDLINLIFDFKGDQKSPLFENNKEIREVIFNSEEFNLKNIVIDRNWQSEAL